MFVQIGKQIGSSLRGSRGAAGVLQGACLALALGLGTIKLLKIGFKVDKFFWRQFIRPGKRLKKYGSWAAVTGATDGIGRAYCDSLAKQGLNILLISRTESKLAAAAQEIEAKYGVQTKTLAIDLVAAGHASYTGPDWEKLKTTFSSIELGVLVNNAGQAPERPELFHEHSAATLDSILAINCMSLSKVVHAALPGMLSRSRGAIVNISSASSSLEAAPMVALYAASKAFVDHFSSSLHAEYSSFGIHVQAQSPAYVSTKMSKQRPSLFSPTPDAYAASAVKHIGYGDYAVPYPPHALQRPMFEMPKCIMKRVIMKSMTEKRKKIDAKAVKKASNDDPAAA